MTSLNNQYLSFEEAREFVRKLKIRTTSDWQKYCIGALNGYDRKPDYIPRSPEQAYRRVGWVNYKDWLNEPQMDFDKAKDFVITLGLNNKQEWLEYCQNKFPHLPIRPSNLPRDPDLRYRKHWKNWEDWLTGDTCKVHGVWRAFEEARDFVRKLELQNQIEWKLYCKNELDGFEKKPSDIPTDPRTAYENDGWIDYSNWLGTTPETSQKSRDFAPLFTMEDLINEYKSNSTIAKLLTHFSNNSNLKSIVELNLDENDISEVEEVFFHFRGEPGKLTQTKKAFVGLIFLVYVIYKLEPKLKYTSLWKAITDDLEYYSTVTTYFLDSYFIKQKHPNYFLKESLEYACDMFNLRNSFETKDEHQYLRNTILLQIGLLNNSFDHLKLWLSNYNLPIIVSELLDVDSQNYSKEFNDGWRVLRRFRDNILSSEQAKNILIQNNWYKHLNLDDLLKAAKQRAKKQLMITQDEDLPIFYLEKICYDEDGLSFSINAQDLYSLNLSGFRYEIYIDDEYKGVLIANDSKELVLESSIKILNPEVNQIDLELRNEDDDVVYSTEITLFDFTEQMVLFDEDGNIYQNIFKKLNAYKKYHILMDSDLDCEFNESSQREYFDGYATLVPFIGYKDSCKITYNDELLFELNFTEHIEKPDFIDKLVLYTATNSSFTLDNEYNFDLRIMQVDSKTEEDVLNCLPTEAKIIKWSYSGGYADSDEIENNSTISSKLYPEMITSPKHTLLIKYKSRVFKKVVYCNFFEKQNHYRLFQISNDGTNKLVDRTSYLTRRDLKKYRYFLSDFSRSEVFYIKNKSNFYQKVKSNRIINFSKFDGYGETIFISEHLFNSQLISFFNYKNSDEYISISQDNLKEIVFHKDLPEQSKLICLDKNYNEYELLFHEIKDAIQNNTYQVENNLISVILIQGSSILDSSYNDLFLDSCTDDINSLVIKNLLVANYPFLSKQSYTNFLRNFIMDDFEEFFYTFYNNRIIINENLLQFEFSKINLLIEHILFGLELDKQMSEQVLQKAILNKQEELLIDTPIVLFKLLYTSKSKKLIEYFQSYVSNAELEDERDESFIELIINNLFNTTTLSGPQKHNLKVAMHYINGQYYLKKALERLNG